MTQGPRPTAISAARAGLAAIWCGTLMGLALVIDHPVGLAAILVTVCFCGWLVGCSRVMARTAKYAVPLAAVVAFVNALVSKDGVTVLARLGHLPVLGRIDITLEALVYGGILGLRVVTVSLVAALFTAAVDQDELLRILRGRSGRFGLAAAVAGRLLPLLAADGARMAEARKSLPDGTGVSRMNLVTAIATGALDRAGDAAAALELRGLGDGPCLVPRQKQRWSRHDFALMGSSLVAIAIVSVSLLGGWISFHSSSRVTGAWGFGLLLTVVLMTLVLIAPMLQRRGTVR